MFIRDYELLALIQKNDVQGLRDLDSERVMKFLIGSKVNGFGFAVGHAHWEMVDYLITLANKQSVEIKRKILSMHDSEAFLKTKRVSHLEAVKCLISQAAEESVNTKTTILTEAFLGAVGGGHLELLRDLVYLANQMSHKTLRDILSSYCCEVFNQSARNGHLDVLKYLVSLASEAPPKTKEQMLHAAFVGAAKGGHLNVVEYLTSLASEESPETKRLNFRVAFTEAVEGGRLEILKYLIQLADKDSPTTKSEMLSLYSFQVFNDAARNGHLNIVEYLNGLSSKESPEKKKQMLHAAFVGAAKGGHLEILDYLIGLAADKDSPTTKSEMLSLYSFQVFSEVARNGHLNVVEYSISLASEESPEKKKQMLHAAFVGAAKGGHLEILDYLIGLAADKDSPTTKSEMLKAGDFYSFQMAATNGHLEVVKYLIRLSDEESPGIRRKMLSENLFSGFVNIAYRGHTLVLNELLKYQEVREYSLRALGQYSLGPRIFNASTDDKDTHDLLRHPAIFEHACSHHWRQMRPFITKQLEALRKIKPYGEPLSRVKTQEEAQCLVYLLHHLIKNEGLAAMSDIEFILSLPELHELIPQPLPPQNTSNLALREILRRRYNEREPEAQSAWDRMIVKLHAIPEVRIQAERDGNYASETQGGFDIRAVVQNAESSMMPLSPQEEEQMSILQKHYQERLEPFNGPDGVSLLVSAFEVYYNREPAEISMTKRKTIRLPSKWEDFKKLNLSEEAERQALKAYYQHPVHTAIRLLLRPNPWIARNASFVEVLDEGGRAADYESLSQLIKVLALAALDQTLPPLPNSGFDLAGRVNLFFKELALINRAHNWDNKKNAKGAAVDDLEGDKPSCSKGMKKRLMQSLVAHPLFVPMDALISMKLNEAVHHMVQEKLNELDNQGITDLWDELNQVVLGDRTETQVEVTWSNEAYQAFVNQLLMTYPHFNKELFTEAIDTASQAYRKGNLLLLGDVYLWVEGELLKMAQSKGLDLPPREVASLFVEQKPEDALTQIKNMVAFYKDNGGECEIFKKLGQASSIEEYEALWLKWTPSEGHEQTLAKELTTRFSEYFPEKLEKSVAYSELPSFYQALNFEEYIKDNSKKIEVSLEGLQKACRDYLAHHGLSKTPKKSDKFLSPPLKKKVEIVRGILKQIDPKLPLIDRCKNLKNNPAHFKCLRENRHSGRETAFKVFACLTLVLGIILAAKRCRDSKGQSINFFQPLSAQVAQSVGRVLGPNF